MNRPAVWMSVLLLFGCSQSKLMHVMTKSPRMDIDDRERQGNKYQQDVYYLAAVIRNAYPRLGDKINAAQFEAETGRLIQACKHIRSDHDFAVALQQFMAKLKDGHSSVNSLSFYKKGDNRYSISLFIEGDRFLVSNIDRTADSTLVGHPVIAINGIPIKMVQQRITNFESSENEHFAYYRFQNKVAYPDYWKAIGVIQTPRDSLALTILNGNGEPVTVHLTPKPHYNFYKIINKQSPYPFTKQQNNGFFYKILEDEKVGYLQMNTCLDYVAVKSEIDNYTNFITKPLALSFMKKRTRHAENFGLVLQKLFSEIQEKDIQTLVLDLRYNTGGDERLGKQLIWYLTERTNVKGFQDYYQISGYLKQQVKQDYKFFAKQYKKKYGATMPVDTLLHITKSIFDDPAYFQDIEKPESPFLLDRRISKFKGKVYVLTAPRTFSAAQVLATTLKDNGLAVIVGAPVGNKPSCQTGASLFKLPNTKLIISLSYLYMERPDTSRNDENTLYPDVLIEKTLPAMRNGHDEPFEWIIGSHQ
jgi:hypothetical protein